MRGISRTHLHSARAGARRGVAAAVCALTVAATLSWVVPAVSAAVPGAAGRSASASPSSPWAIVPSPDLAYRRGSNQLTGVSCVSSSFCMAVGYAGDGGGFDTLTEVWDGSTWSIVPSPNVSGSIYDYLQAVSCTSTTFCMAVGYEVPGGKNVTLVETFDGGSWSIVPSPNEPGSADDYLHGVSCRSAGECTLVGAYINTRLDLDGTLVETWNGGFLSIRPSPNGSSYLNDLAEVSCSSRSFCAAVGNQTAGHAQFERTLAETTKTADWSVEPVGDASTFANELDGVSCTSADLCRAVGWFFNGTATRPLVEEWDGTAWSVKASPNFGVTLNAVSCRSADACTAVGNGGLIESWDGVSWAVVRTDRTIDKKRHLAAVSCDTATVCTAVGSWFDGTIYHTFIEQRGLAVTSVTPDKGGVAGDAHITVRGFDLLEAQSIDFFPKSGGAGIPAKSFKCSSEEVCEVVTPDVRSRLTGKEIGLDTDVVVETPTATSAKVPGDKYTFGGPVVDSVTESSGPLKGENVITVSGSGFKGADSVSFVFTPPGRGVQIDNTHSFTAVSGTEIRVKVPDITSLDPVLNNDELATEVQVGVPNGHDGTLESALDPSKDTYTFLGPKVEHLSVENGPLDGGEKITVHGQGFTGTHFVWFIDTGSGGPEHAYRASDVVVAAGGRSLTALVPNTALDGAFLDSNNEMATQVQVDIFSRDGTTKYSSSFNPKHDKYVFQAPVITGLSQDHGPLVGDVPIDITGRGFSAGDTVKFVVTSGPNIHDAYEARVVGVKATMITVRLPDVANKGVKVVFSTNKLPTQIVVALAGPGKRTYASVAQPKDADVFNYDGPEINKLKPATGPAAGGTDVTITGLGLTGVYKVEFQIGVGQQATLVDAPKFKVIDDTTLTVTSPSMSGQTFVGGKLTTQIRVSVAGSFQGIDDFLSPTTDADQFVYTNGASRAIATAVVTGTGLRHAVQLRPARS